MRRIAVVVFGTAFMGIGAMAQGRAPVPVPGDHSKVPPAQPPSLYFSGADIEKNLNNADPKRLATQTGAGFSFGRKYDAAVRRRIPGPQFAITHTREMEILVVTEGSASLVTGGTIVPPTIPSDIYPNPDPNSTIRSAAGIKDGATAHMAAGDVFFIPPGTPHWNNQIDGMIQYVEIRVPDIDPLPGVERAEVPPPSSTPQPPPGKDIPGDHSRVPPARVPAIHYTSADIDAILDKVDPKVLASQTGGSMNLEKGFDAVIRRRVAGPQYAITHSRDLEYLIILKGSATIVTGGALVPPIIPSDIYPNPDPNATIRSASGIVGGVEKHLVAGDVMINPPGTAHWFSKIDGMIQYVEIRQHNVDPAPAVESVQAAK